MNGHLELVRFLIEQSVESNLNSLLVSASSYGHLDIVQYLVEQGADIHYYNDWPLQQARVNLQPEVVEYFEGLIAQENESQDSPQDSRVRRFFRRLFSLNS